MIISSYIHLHTTNCSINNLTSFISSYSNTAWTTLVHFLMTGTFRYCWNTYISMVPNLASWTMYHCRLTKHLGHPENEKIFYSFSFEFFFRFNRKNWKALLFNAQHQMSTHHSLFKHRCAPRCKELLHM